MEKTAVKRKTGADWGRLAIQFVLKYGIYLVFLILCAIIAVASPVFLTVRNLTNVLLQTSSVGIIAVGMTFVIIARGIDVSVGSIVALASAVGVSAMKANGQPWWLGMLLMLGVGVIVGLVNGISSAQLKMPAFLVTLATMIMANGFVLAMSGGKWFYGLPPVFGALGRGKLGPLPLPVVIMLLTFLGGYLLLSKTVFGRRVYAIGGNPDAARVSGINVERVYMLTFVLSGLLSGLSSLVLSARLDSFSATMGQGYEFSAIAGVVMGGTSLAGGEGNMGGTLVGILMIGVINNALNLLGVSVFYQDVIRGAIIFTAVLLDTLRKRYSYLIE